MTSNKSCPGLLLNLIIYPLSTSLLENALPSISVRKNPKRNKLPIKRPSYNPKGENYSCLYN